MPVNHRYRLIFRKTRKTASTSREIGLSKFAGADDIVTPFVPEDERTRRALGFSGPRNHGKPPLGVRSDRLRQAPAQGAARPPLLQPHAVPRSPCEARRAPLDGEFHVLLRGQPVGQGRVPLPLDPSTHGSGPESRQVRTGRSPCPGAEPSLVRHRGRGRRRRSGPTRGQGRNIRRSSASPGVAGADPGRACQDPPTHRRSPPSTRSSRRRKPISSAETSMTRSSCSATRSEGDPNARRMRPPR